MNELKPCPFCGGKVQLVHDMETLETTGVYCLGCKGMARWPGIIMRDDESYGEHKEKIVKAWNRRKE